MSWFDLKEGFLCFSSIFFKLRRSRKKMSPPSGVSSIRHFEWIFNRQIIRTFVFLPPASWWCRAYWCRRIPWIGADLAVKSATWPPGSASPAPQWRPCQSSGHLAAFSASKHVVGLLSLPGREKFSEISYLLPKKISVNPIFFSRTENQDEDKYFRI